MTEDVIEQYDTFNTKLCSNQLIFGDFNDQYITSDYINSLNDEDGNVNNISVNIVDDDLPDK